MLGSHTVFRVLMLASVLCLAAFVAQADPGKGNGAHGKPHQAQDKGTGSNLSLTLRAGISVGDARALASRYRLTGGKPLPPGIRKNLARGKPLPPGIQRTRMPVAFIERLPRHEGYEWRRAGTDLVLVVSGTLVVTDVLHGVFD